jgi:ketosteroid isomerase-like protein
VESDASKLKELTKQYVASFNAKDTAACSDLMMNDFVFEHPFVKRVVGKAEAARFIGSVFSSCKRLSFVDKKIFTDGDTTIVEFVLTLDNRTFTGVDIIEWRSGKMREIRRAYRDL